MMRLDVRPHVNELIADLGTMGMKQAPFAVRQGIDATARDAGQAVKNIMRQRFRYSAVGWKWIESHVKVMKTGQEMAAREIGKTRTSRAGGGDMRAWVAIIPPPAKGELASWSRYRGSFIAAMEAGGPTPGPRDFGGRLGLGRYAVPITKYDERPRFPLAMFPINLGLSSRRSVEGPMTRGSLVGKRRTFLLPIVNAPGHAVIFQRYGRKKNSDVMPLFWTQNETRLPARRYFFSTVEMVVRTQLTGHLSRAMEHALFSRGAYGRGGNQRAFSPLAVRQGPGL
ncbi:MAG: hypothetical protein ACYC0B_02025 [Gemmatimonadaceae bacterium]